MASSNSFCAEQPLSEFGAGNGCASVSDCWISLHGEPIAPRRDVGVSARRAAPVAAECARCVNPGERSADAALDAVGCAVAPVVVHVAQAVSDAEFEVAPGAVARGAVVALTGAAALDGVVVSDVSAVPVD